MLIAVTIFGAIVAGALNFLTAQNRAFDVGSQRMNSLTNLQFAMQMLDTDIPTLGSNLVPNQPGVVYAADSTLAFNADLATNAANDPFAVFYDPDAPTGQVTSPSSAVTIPLTTFSWPSTAFTTGLGTPAPAELIQYGFYQDASTARTDDYILGRSVNGGSFEIVAQNILQPSNGDPFMRFFIYRAYPSAPTELDSIASGSLPLNANDFLADSIRAVRISMRSTNGLSGTNERITEMTRLITMKNAGMRQLSTCGDAPTPDGSDDGDPGHGRVRGPDRHAGVGILGGRRKRRGRRAALRTLAAEYHARDCLRRSSCERPRRHRQHLCRPGSQFGERVPIPGRGPGLYACPLRRRPLLASSGSLRIDGHEDV